MVSLPAVICASPSLSLSFVCAPVLSCHLLRGRWRLGTLLPLLSFSLTIVLFSCPPLCSFFPSSLLFLSLSLSTVQTARLLPASRRRSGAQAGGGEITVLLEMPCCLTITVSVFDAPWLPRLGPCPLIVSYPVYFPLHLCVLRLFAQLQAPQGVCRAPLSSHPARAAASGGEARTVRGAQ